MAIKKHTLERAQRHTDRDLSMLTDSGVVNCLISTIEELKREILKECRDQISDYSDDI
jgi:hypothetical protein